MITWTLNENANNTHATAESERKSKAQKINQLKYNAIYKEKTYAPQPSKIWDLEALSNKSWGQCALLLL